MAAIDKQWGGWGNNDDFWAQQDGKAASSGESKAAAPRIDPAQQSLVNQLRCTPAQGYDIDLGTNNLIIGKQAAGKSWLIKNLVYYNKHKFHRIYVINPFWDTDKDRATYNFLPKRFSSSPPTLMSSMSWWRTSSPTKQLTRVTRPW